MTRPLDLAYYAIFSLLFLSLTILPVAAAEGEAKEAGQELPKPDAGGEGGVPAEEERQVETLEHKGGFLGYNVISRDGYGGRAVPYGFLRSSRSGGLYYKNLQKDSNLDLEGNFLNEHDYHGDLLLDYQGDYRLHLRTESLFHNLDRETLFAPEFQTGRADLPPPATALYQAKQDPAQIYGLGVTQDLAAFRYRLHNFPLHVNLGYWRLVKEGTMQQRFADIAFEGTPNTIYAQARGVKRQTQEGSLGLDAHLGWLDIIYDLRIRSFEDKLSIPTATYEARNHADGSPDLLGGPLTQFQHNEDPDSRFISHTVKLHSALSGGVVASASYSIDQRENLSRLTDTAGVRHATVNLQNAAGDFVYTPIKEFSLALKYRRQELSNDNRSALSNLNFFEPAQVVKPPVDSSKDLVIGTLSYRPVHDLSLTGEYRGEFLKRDHVSTLPSLATWDLPEHSDSQLGSLALIYRPMKGARLTAKYSYATTDHPSYGNSFEQKHQGELLTTYTGNGSWGVTGNVTVKREWNDQVEHSLVNVPFTDPVGYTASPALSGQRRTENANLSFWLAPCERLTLNANYAFLMNRVDQTVLFTGVFNGSQAATDFSSRSHVFGLNASYALNEKLDLSLALQQIRSNSSFEPEATTFTVIPGDTAGIREITEQDTVISSASTRGEYRFTSRLSSSLEYTLKDYNEKNPVYSAHNGTVHAVLACLTAKW